MQQAILKPSEVHMGKMTFSEKSVVHSLARVQSLVWCWCSQDNFKKTNKSLGDQWYRHWVGTSRSGADALHHLLSDRTTV